MTVLHAIDGDKRETMTQGSARRLRGALAERRMSARQLSSLLGMSYTWMSVRVNGKKSMSLDELEAIERVTGISAAYLITGIKNRRPDGPDGGYSERATRDSNPQPSDPKVVNIDVKRHLLQRGDSGQWGDGDVIPFPLGA